MSEFQIITDTTADLPKDYIEKYRLACMCLPYTIQGKTYKGEEELSFKEFYSLMREGEMPSTSQVNPVEAKEYFQRYLKDSKEILYLSFSSGLSGTYNSVSLAAEELKEENPDCKIQVIDTLCASLGEGLLVHKAVKLREQGKSMEETAQWIKEHIANMVHIFTVDDLNHLYRGGRVSKAAAVVGTLAGIKPILHVDEEGKLVALDKVRGRKKSLSTLVDYMEKYVGDWKDKNDIIFISHGDALEDALFVKEEVTKRFGITDFMIENIGPTIGAHSGPGTIALFFMGDKR